MNGFWAGFGWGALSFLLLEIAIVITLIVIYVVTQSKGRKINELRRPEGYQPVVTKPFRGDGPNTP